MKQTKILSHKDVEFNQVLYAVIPINGKDGYALLKIIVERLDQDTILFQGTPYLYEYCFTTIQNAADFLVQKCNQSFKAHEVKKKRVKKTK